MSLDVAGGARSGGLQSAWAHGVSQLNRGVGRQQALGHETNGLIAQHEGPTHG